MSQGTLEEDSEEEALLRRMPLLLLSVKILRPSFNGFNWLDKLIFFDWLKPVVLTSPPWFKREEAFKPWLCWEEVVEEDWEDFCEEEEELKRRGCAFSPSCNTLLTFS